MKTIYYIFFAFLGTYLTLAETTHWQNEAEILLWIQTKDTLEISEYVGVLESLKDWNRAAPFKTNNARKIADIASKLIFKEFSSQLDARDSNKVSELFGGICVYHHGVNEKMMDSLADCNDVEFVARIVHRSLDRISWDNYGSFSLPLINSRRKLFNKIMGKSETYERIFSKYRRMDRLAQEALKKEIEKKWPVLVEENTREPKRKTSTFSTSNDGTGPADSPQAAPINPSATDSKFVRWLWMAVLVLFAFAIIIALLKRR